MVSAAVPMIPIMVLFHSGHTAALVPVVPLERLCHAKWNLTFNNLVISSVSNICMQCLDRMPVTKEVYFNVISKLQR